MACSRALALCFCLQWCRSAALALTRQQSDLADGSGAAQWPWPGYVPAYYAPPPPAYAYATPPPSAPQKWPPGAWTKMGKVNQSDIAFYYLNLNSSTTRRLSMEQQGKRLGIKLHRVDAVNAKALGAEESRQLVPCLDYPGHAGTRGLLLSQKKAFQQFLDSSKQPWLAVFEDDADLQPELLSQIGYAMHVRPDAAVIYMDERNPSSNIMEHTHAPDCCMSFNLYKRSAVQKMLPEMDSTRNGSYINVYRNASKSVKDHPDCLHDWFNGNLLSRVQIAVANNPVVGSGSFKSTITGQHQLKETRSDEELVRASLLDGDA